MIEIVTAALAAISLSMAEPTVDSGYLSAYAPGMMDYQVDYRVSIGDAPPDAWERYTVFIAVADCGAIGDTWLIRPVNHDDGRKGEWVEALVVDCAGDIPTVQWLESSCILAEVGWETWETWQPFRGERGLGVEVIDG